MSPVQGKSPIVQVKEPYSNLDMITCRLSFCSGVYKVHMPRKGVRLYIEKERKLCMLVIVIKRQIMMIMT